MLVTDSPDDGGRSLFSIEFVSPDDIYSCIYIRCIIVLYVHVYLYLGKGGHESSLVNGNSGDPMAFGEIVRQKDVVKRVSAMRQKSYISQVASSRVVAPTKEGDDQLHGNDNEDDEQDDSFFKDEGDFEA